MIQHFSLTVSPKLFSPILQRNFFPLRLCHQTSATKLCYLRSSAFYKQPKKVEIELAASL